MNYKIKITICLVLILIIVIINRVYIYPHYNVVKIISDNELSTKTGYGIVYKKDKKTYIVTNYHIINNSDKIIIQYGFKDKIAKLVNGDEYEDIAVLSVDNDKRLLPAQFQVMYHINDRVRITHNKGYIRTKNKKVLVKLSNGNYLINTLKVNLPVSLGDSGKPLYHGNNVIGMMSMVDDKEKNIGYAIDINKVLKVAHQLETKSIKRPDLNVQLASTTNKKILKKYKLSNHGLRGVIVTDNYNSKLLKKGDIIVSINNKKIEDIVHFKYYLYNTQKYTLLVYRNSTYITIKNR